MMEHFIDGDIIAFDSETTGLSPYHGDLPFAFSFCNETGETAYFEFEVDVFSRKPIPILKLVDRMKLLLEDKSITKVGHHLKFDARMMKMGLGIRLKGPIHETMFMSHVCKADERSHQLKPLSEHYLDVPKDDETTLKKAVMRCRRAAGKLGWKINQSRMGVDKDNSASKADYWLPSAFWKRRKSKGAEGEAARLLIQKYPNLGDLCRIYATRDAERTMLLHLMYKDLIGKKDLWEVYKREIKLWPVVYAMENRGVYCDVERTRQELVICDRVIAEKRKIIVGHFGEFNKKAPDARIRNYIFGTGPKCLGLIPRPHELTAKTKQPQVGKAILNRLSDKYPALGAITEHDRYLKARGTYFQNYLKMQVNGIIHCNFNQMGPITGRFSSRNPNLQNVPKRAADGDVMKRVRGPFGPREGYIWGCFDYKSIEARLFSEESGDPDMIRIFRDGGDVYVELVKRVVTALQNFVRANLLTKVKSLRKIVIVFTPILQYGSHFLDEMFAALGGARQVCKNNFLGWTYGEGTRKMAMSMKLPYEVAEIIVLGLRSAFPRAPLFMREMQDKAKQDGYIRNRYGRIVPIPPRARIKDEETGEWKWIEFYYKAVNYLIQPDAADLIKEAMIRLHRLLRLSGKKAYLVMQIHDELVVEIKRGDASPKFLKKIAACMADNRGMFTEVETPVDIQIVEKSWEDKSEFSDWEDKWIS